jgi:hypothetical protein
MVQVVSTLPLIANVWVWFHAIFFHDATDPVGPGPPHCQSFTITQRHTRFGRTSLDEGSARRRDLYLTTRNTHKRQTSMPLALFETVIPTNEQLRTHTLDRATSEIGDFKLHCVELIVEKVIMGHVSIRVLRVFRVSIMPLTLHIHLSITDAIRSYQFRASLNNTLKIELASVSR